ncbi:MAG: four-carbon acid sugar kinase family protein [Rhodospirillales bacterium]
MAIILGCIADDFTGATDLANTLVKNGMRTVQVNGVPSGARLKDLGDAEAVVVALKSRTCPVHEAVADSLAALEWLKGLGTSQIFFKYCSTFDSTDVGNIGPVADALLDALHTDFAIACPAFPTTGRTIYKGYLFVNDVLLSESSLKDHPLTPMRDANLVRVLSRQTDELVGLVEHKRVRQGADAVADAFQTLKKGGHRYAIVDALDDADLGVIGQAVADHPLVTGGSGIALGLPDNYRRQGLLGAATKAELPNVAGPAVIIAGSCSQATRGQVARARKLWPHHKVDPMSLGDVADAARAMADKILAGLNSGPQLIYSTADPDTVQQVQSALGRNQAGDAVERFFGRLARNLRDGGVRRFVVAGGETSGAVVQALGVQAMRIGPEIDPGVPWTESLTLGSTGEAPLALTLKSGNFGAEDFFEKALGMLDERSAA